MIKKLKGSKVDCHSMLCLLCLLFLMNYIRLKIPNHIIFTLKTNNCIEIWWGEGSLSGNKPDPSSLWGQILKLLLITAEDLVAGSILSIPVSPCGCTRTHAPSVLSPLSSHVLSPLPAHRSPSGAWQTDQGTCGINHSSAVRVLRLCVTFHVGQQLLRAQTSALMDQMTGHRWDIKQVVESDSEYQMAPEASQHFNLVTA